MRRLARNGVKLGWLTIAAAASAVAVAGAAASHEAAAIAPAGGGLAELVLQVTPGPRASPDDTNRSIATIRRRLDLFGIKNVQIIRQGRDRIAVEALGDPIPARLPAVLTKTGRLTFQLVDDAVSASDLESGRLPADDMLGLNADQACGSDCSFALKREAWVTGDMIVRAMQSFGQNDEPTVAFLLDGRGTHLFAEATNENVGKRFAIVLDGRVVEAPVIETPILGGKGQISGNFTVESANDLAVLLQSGSLPAQLVVVAERPEPPLPHR